MRKLTTAVLAMCAVYASVTGQESVYLGGLVHDQSNAPLAGAVVSLKDRGVFDTTAGDGRFLLAASSGIRGSSPALRSVHPILLLEGDVATVRVDRPSHLRVAVFALQGRNVCRLVDEMIPAGSFSRRLPGLATGQGMYLVRASVGNAVATAVYCANGSVGAGGAPARTAGLHKMAAGTDSLIVALSGYLTSRVPVRSLRTNVNVTLFPAAFRGIVSPLPGVELLAGDTIDVVWSGLTMTSPAVSYNYHDTAGTFNDALWHVLDSARVLARGPGSVRLALPAGARTMSRNFQMKVKDAVTGDSVVSAGNQLDHVVMLSPTNGETFRTGDTLRIAWRSNRYFYDMLICFATGVRLEMLTPDLAIYYPQMSMDWVIGGEQFSDPLPDSLSDGILYLRAYNDADCNGHRSAPGLMGDFNEIPITIVK